MEKFARDAVADDRIQCKEDIVVSSSCDWLDCLWRLFSFVSLAAAAATAADDDHDGVEIIRETMNQQRRQ